MIIINQPEVISKDNKARLQSLLEIDGEKKLIWFEVDKDYEEYLCYERADAFVIGLLHFAMREGHDIICKAPIGEDLYYQISTYFIDSLYNNSKKMHRTKITAEIDSTKLPSANAVGTGNSRGIDSFHAIASHSDSKFTKHNITHLAFNNVGSHGEGEKGNKKYLGRLKKSREFANKYNFKFIETNSNIHEEIKQSHLHSHTFTSCFAIYCLQKLYSIYYYSSAYTFAEFSLKENDKYAAGYYDLLTLNMFSTASMKIISEGATLSRLEKTKKVAQFEPSFEYLNVCPREIENCSKCEKCTRTMLTLDAIGKLEKYDSVFDVEYYRKNKSHYLTTLVQKKIQNNIFYNELYPYFKKQLNLNIRLKGYLKVILSHAPKLMPYVPNNMKDFLKKQYIRHS